MKEDGDLFNDSFIKCYEAIKDRNFDEETTIKYFITVLSNNFKKKKNNNIEFTDIHGIDEDDIFEMENHSEIRYEICDIIHENVINKFGEEKYHAWKLHFIDNKSYEELIEMGFENMNFHNLFRQINLYIKHKLPKENGEFKTLLKKLAFI